MAVLRLIALWTVVMWSLHCSAQDVTLICNGEGNTKEEATRNALRDAIEQTYGSFVSSNTVVINDELIKDEIVSLSRGNVKRYRELYYSDGDVKKVTLEAVISVDKLISYAKNKGMSTELAGASFAMNFKLRQLYVENGAKAMKALLKTLLMYGTKMYDFNITTKEPTMRKNDVLVDVTVSYRLNRNGVMFYKTYKETVSTIFNSINSINIEGIRKDDAYSKKIEAYKNLMEKLPRVLAHNFDVTDNLNDTVTYEYIKGKLALKAVGVKAEATTRLPKECYNRTQGTWTPNIYNDMCEVYNRIGTLEKRKSYMDLDPRVPLPKVGQVNGTIRFTIVYTMDQISKVSKIQVTPCRD